MSRASASAFAKRCGGQGHFEAYCGAILISDLLTVLALIALEGLLSADNALVMAVMVLGLPAGRRKKALRYGLIGGFAFRTVATLLAIYLIQVAWVKLLGGLYLLYLTYQHFSGGEAGSDRRTPPKARPWLGMNAFWATVVRVELVNLAFSIDSILVAVAMSPKLWVVLSGGILGIVALRLVVGRLLTLIERYPALVDGAFVIIAWVGIKLILEYLHRIGVVHFEVPQSLSLLLIALIFALAYAYARREERKRPHPIEDQAVELLEEEKGTRG